MQENTEKSTSNRLNEVLAQLSKDQLRFVVASLDYPNKKEAAEAVGLKSNTVYGWPEIVNEAIKLMALETGATAVAIRHRNLVKAMSVKVAGLDSDDEAVRQKAATELIEWELGKAGNTVALTGADGGAVEQTITVIYQDAKKVE